MMVVPVSRPQLGEAEKAFVNQALEANAISGIYGEFLERFETEFAAMARCSAVVPFEQLTA